tara:strand:+ start:15281 stop:15667 length:387 start_codon:yes stop_codon:yes gene_type:complete
MKYFYTYIFVIFLIISCGKKEVTKETIKDEIPIVKELVEETVNEIEKVPEIIFTVQIAALKNQNTEYNRIENIHTFYEGNFIKYRLGQFVTYKSARAYRASVLTRYSGAFIQALKNGEPINIQQALNQ